MKRHGSADWQGDIKFGQGSLSSESGLLDNTPFSFKDRFMKQKGTNPEELIATALSGCFTMALAARLTQKGKVADNIHTTSIITLEHSQNNEFSIPNVHLQVHAKMPAEDRDLFYETAREVKRTCPVARLLSCDLTMYVTLDM